MKKIEKRSDCPISYALDFVGDKWSLLIIRDLSLEGKKFYKDFLHSKEGIATNVLSDRLKKLEAADIIQWKTYEKLKTQKEYSLTSKGKALIPVLLEIIAWSAQYDPELLAPPAFVQRIKSDRDQLIKDIMAHLDEP